MAKSFVKTSVHIYDCRSDLRQMLIFVINFLISNTFLVVYGGHSANDA